MRLYWNIFFINRSDPKVILDKTIMKKYSFIVFAPFVRNNMIKKETKIMKDKIASFVLDENQYNNVLALCEMNDMNFSELLRIAIRDVALNHEDNIPNTYKKVKKGVRLSENDIKFLAYVMRKYGITNISEACRMSLLILLKKCSRNYNLNN